MTDRDNYTECEVFKGTCGCQGFGDKAGGAVEAGRETVEAGGALCGVGGAGGYYSVFDK